MEIVAGLLMTFIGGVLIGFASSGLTSLYRERKETPVSIWKSRGFRKNFNRRVIVGAATLYIAFVLWTIGVTILFRP